MKTGERDVIENERTAAGNQGGQDTEPEINLRRLVRHGMGQAHAGGMDKPDAHALVTGPCGDTDEFFLRITGGRIRQVRFQTTGCFFTLASAEAAASLAEGRTVREALRVNKEAVLEALGGLPKDHEHCALLAVNTLHRALRAHIIRGKGL